MNEFGDMFEKLTDYPPLRWQCRLYEQWREGSIKPVIDLPTGMGKTSVMAIWFIARAKQVECGEKNRLPTRLVYVVDRRTVVDQATTLAEKIKAGAKDAKIEAPKISTLRGQLADNREWSRDPSKPAIIIGTVDLIGSGLLFSGYRSRYKYRPLEAGLLGQDSLLILDEAHLSKPFEKLINEICHTGRFQKDRDGKPCGMPVKVVSMSATSAPANGDVFRLEGDFGAGTGDFADSTIRQRYSAAKRLKIPLPFEKGKLSAAMAKAAAELAKDNSRVVVFVRSPGDATKIAKEIMEHGDKKNKPFKDAVAILTGTMRGLERDELLNKPVMKRFLEPQNRPADGPAILVSTSAGEVGFDLNADHLVCDATPLDSIIQRLGRVNRRGDGDAQVHLFSAKPEEKKKNNKVKSGEEAGGKAPGHTFEAATLRATEILNQLPKLPDDSLDASPKALADLEKPGDALTPKPTIVEVTDILLDAWSMTTIVEPMPGRPPVADWLRGIADDLPDTTIAWRAELDVDGFGDLDITDIEEWFDAHRVLPHETLTVPAYKASEWMLKRWKCFDEKAQSEIGDHSCIIDQGGLRKITVKELIGRLEKEQMRDFVNADIILPTSFGGIERNCGLLDSAAPKRESDSVTDIIAKAPDIADEQLPGVNRRYRLIKIGETEEALCGDEPPDTDAFSKFVLDLPPDVDNMRQLISMEPKRDRPEFGSRPQSLTDHVTDVEKHATEIAARLALSSPFAEALQLAAKYHDHGKNRDLWQRLVHGRTTPAGLPWLKETMGKSGDKTLRDSSGYRHEFGSLREFIDANAGQCDAETFDLAMHLIATHHGRARPHFPKGGFDPDAPAKSPEIATEAMRRFARLQRQYGYWRLAWLENLLRCADALASSENDGRNGK